ncbi:CPBP family intramembrane metalloprotease [Muricauda sp. CAU 1633]|uniref:CPBP family intramembrane glutamic endopeptidase n=1 Tax=Allomuricauda sp. CAU 1633 TaxID=2816036 RepID=UPI001A8DF7FD|nr:CPBP family intramembrane glutamic endopeptidase [Muricauda sp. CAU 1633]MBO0322257.1 CPBP family intramembrane metalloprotease [Muricauda sp. CAU 1633]
MKNSSPFFLGVIIIFTIFFIMLIPIDVFLSDGYWSPFQIEYTSLAIKMSLIFIVAMIGIKRLKLFSLAGLSRNNKWTSKLLNTIPFYLFLIGISSVIGKDLSGISITNLLLLLFACLSVGFAEEFMFRGFLQPFFIQKYVSKKNGLFKSIMFSAMFFGASHLINLMVNDNVPQVLGQSIYAILIGFFFGVLLLKTNKLFPIAITHGLINFFFLFNSLPSIKSSMPIDIEPQTNSTLVEQIQVSLLPIIMFLPLFIVGLLVFKKIDKEKILDKLNG